MSLNFCYFAKGACVKENNAYGVDRMGEKPREPRFHGDVSEKSHVNMSKIRGKDTSIELRLRSARSEERR